MIESKFNGEDSRPFFPYQLGPTQSSATITSSCQVLLQQVLVTRAHAASERFLPFLRGTSAAGTSEASCVGLSAAAPTDGACAALTVGPASGVVSAIDNRAATSADIAVSITVIADMRPSIESRPNIFIGFLAKSGASRTPRTCEFCWVQTTAAVVRARIALSDGAYHMN